MPASGHCPLSCSGEHFNSRKWNMTNRALSLSCSSVHFISRKWNMTTEHCPSPAAACPSSAGTWNCNMATEHCPCPTVACTSTAGTWNWNMTTEHCPCSAVPCTSTAGTSKWNMTMLGSLIKTLCGHISCWLQVCELEIDLYIGHKGLYNALQETANVSNHRPCTT